MFFVLFLCSELGEKAVPSPWANFSAFCAPCTLSCFKMQQSRPAMKKLTFLPAVMLPATLEGKKVTGGKMTPDLCNIPLHAGGDGPLPHLPFYFPFCS